jgi:hypothetical protein
MRDQLCAAFCDGISIRQVRAGLAVSTAFSGPDGDRIGFYVLHDRETSLFRIQDSGVILPSLEASGFSLRSGARSEAMNALLKEYGVEIDYEAREFAIEALTEEDAPAAALRFVAFMLRVRDFMLMTEARVANTFRDDVKQMLKRVLNERVTASASVSFEEQSPIAPDLTEFDADFVLRTGGRAPVGVFLGTSDARLLQALFVQMRAKHEVRVPCSVVALLERDRGISANIRHQASTRLDALVYFTGDLQRAAVERIVDEALGPNE